MLFLPELQHLFVRRLCFLRQPFWLPVFLQQEPSFQRGPCLPQSFSPQASWPLASCLRRASSSPVSFLQLPWPAPFWPSFLPCRLPPQACSLPVRGLQLPLRHPHGNRV